MQKKFTFFAVFLLLNHIGFAQFQKGTTTANFNIGDIRNTNIQNKSFDKNNNITFNPGFGYFIKKNWEVGAGLNFNSAHFRDTLYGGHSYNGNTFGINIYTNYYLGNRKLKPYLTFQTGWNQIKGNSSYAGNQNYYKRRQIYYAIGGGINWNISPRFAVFTEATYNNEYPYATYGDGRLNLTIGARFYFNNKKKRQ
jgi:hypothetical protein